MKCDEEPGSDGCPDLMVERIRYFTGRHMTARDFRDADAYHRTHRHLHNRVLHGSGVACGLGVEQHWNSDCRHDQVIVRCGLAIDCCGREVVIPKDLVSPKIPWDDAPKVGSTEQRDDAYVLVLCLSYRECPTERVPVLYSPTACSDSSFEYGRIRESYELCWRWVRRHDLKNYGWYDPRHCAPPDADHDDDHVHDDKKQHDPDAQQQSDRRHHGQRGYHDHDDDRDCPDDGRPPRCCLEPACPPHHCIVLAIIRAKDRDDFGDKRQIDLRGRQSIATAREHLTHICWINWKHGGPLKAGTIGSLRVRFDRPLLVEPSPKHYPGPRGINERTFVVQYGEQAERRQVEDLDFVQYARPPYLLPDRRTAVYEFLKPFKSYRDHVIHVTLRCDFIVDCLKRPVDGNHLRGLLPTGDGIEGGTFESWFLIVDDADYDKYEHDEHDHASGTSASEESKP